MIFFLSEFHTYIIYTIVHTEVLTLNIFMIQLASYFHILLGTLGCNEDGCECKPGVSGELCDQCEPNLWNFDKGCEPFLKDLDFVETCKDYTKGKM